MTGKNIVVVGASHGIGAALSQALVEKGANVYGVSRSNATVPQGVASIQSDVTLEQLTEDQLPDTIHGLAYLPGSINLKPFHRITRQEFLDDLSVNYFGAIHVLQTALKAMKKAEFSSVVLVSTVAVQTGMPFHASISGAKGAVEGLTRSLAAEWAPKIRVNAVAPALVETRLAEKLLSSDEKKEAANRRHPLGRFGQPNDIAAAMLFLLSSESSWITGQVIGVDGGMSALKI